MTLLTRDDCRIYAEDAHRKDSELKEAYKIGADPDSWIAETDEVVRQAERQREEEELEARENQDQLEDDDDDAETSKASAKKRSAASKPASKPRAKKAKTEKGDSGSSKAGSAQPRKSVGAAGEDEGGDGEIFEEATKRVRNWRHALQRAFLPKDRLPLKEDVKDQDVVFLTVENSDITADQLKATKIGKVMRKILSLESIPLDDVHHFRRRAEALVAKWNAIQSGTWAEGIAEASSKGEETYEISADAPLNSSAPVAEIAKAPAATNGNGTQKETNGKTQGSTEKAAEADAGDVTELKENEVQANVANV